MERPIDGGFRDRGPISASPKGERENAPVEIVTAYGQVLYFSLLLTTVLIMALEQLADF